jgi:hypothetical protein
LSGGPPLPLLLLLRCRKGVCEGAREARQLLGLHLAHEAAAAP